MINMSYARGWDESIKLFDEFEKQGLKQKKPLIQTHKFTA